MMKAMVRHSAVIWIMVLVLVLLAFSVNPLSLPKPAQAVHLDPAISAASVSQPGGKSSVFLPAALKNYYAFRPIHLAPKNGAVLTTLIPTYAWDMGYQPPDTIGCLAMDSIPNPGGCQLSFGVDKGRQEIVWYYNLPPDTRYYWRIGAVYNGNYDSPVFHPTWSFTTASAGGVILPAPTPTGPADGGTVSPSSLRLTWKPVAGAVSYSVTFHEVNDFMWYGFDTTEPRLDLSGNKYINPNTTYEWHVKTRNDYAWSDYSNLWTFTTTAAAAKRNFTTEENPHIQVRHPDGRVILQILDQP